MTKTSKLEIEMEESRMESWRQQSALEWIWVVMKQRSEESIGHEPRLAQLPGGNVRNLVKVDFRNMFFSSISKVAFLKKNRNYSSKIRVFEILTSLICCGLFGKYYLIGNWWFQKKWNFQGHRRGTVLLKEDGCPKAQIPQPVKVTGWRREEMDWLTHSRTKMPVRCLR